MQQHTSVGAFHGLSLPPIHSLAREGSDMAADQARPDCEHFLPPDVSRLLPVLPCVRQEIPVYREEPTEAGNSRLAADFSETTRSLKSVTCHQDLPALISVKGAYLLLLRNLMT